MGAPLLGRPEVPVPKGVASATLPSSSWQGTWHLHPSPCPPFFCRCCSVASMKVWSEQVQCIPETRGSQILKRSRGKTRKRNWMDESPNRARKNILKELKLIAKIIWKATENSLEVRYLSICAKLPQIETWVPQDKVKRLKKAIHENTTAGCGTNQEKELHSAVAW